MGLERTEGQHSQEWTIARDRYLALRDRMPDRMRGIGGELAGRVQSVELGDTSPDTARENFVATLSSLQENFDMLLEATERFRAINEKES